MNVFICNDDGIKAPGLWTLVQNLPDFVSPVVVAPANQKSASSHSISLGQKLRVEVYERKGIRHYAVHGTPVDCVKFAISEIKDFKPDIILSGINQGANTGVSVYYSGTLSAAREGLINRIPSVALSLCSQTFQDYSASAAIAGRIVKAYKERAIPRNVLLNVNIPPLALEKIKGIKITKQADSRFIEEFVAAGEHGGKKVYTLAGEIELMDPDGTSDEEVVLDGYVSITPLKIDLTDYQAMEAFKSWLEA